MQTLIFIPVRRTLSEIPLELQSLEIFDLHSIC